MEVIMPLSAREKQVLVFLSQGLSSKEIAKRMCLTDNTVRKYTLNLCRKLSANNRTHAVSVAHKYMLI